MLTPPGSEVYHLPDMQSAPNHFSTVAGSHPLMHAMLIYKLVHKIKNLYTHVETSEGVSY